MNRYYVRKTDWDNYAMIIDSYKKRAIFFCEKVEEAQPICDAMNEVANKAHEAYDIAAAEAEKANERINNLVRAGVDIYNINKDSEYSELFKAEGRMEYLAKIAGV